MGNPPGVDTGLTQGFWMLETEVTQGLWKLVEGKELNWYAGEKGEQYPVYNVTYPQAVSFIAKLNGLLHNEGLIPYEVQLALPTEAQWEYAYRAGTKDRYFFGEYEWGLADHAWFDKNSQGLVQPVATRKPNPWNLHDMAGNVWEWTADWYDSTLLGGKDPKGPAEGSARVLKGGSCRVSAGFCRAPYRVQDTPDNSFSQLGFRFLATWSVNETK